MYCPACGAESAQGLRYCKQCGASLNGSESSASPRRLHPVIILAFLMIMGLITLIGLTVPLAASGDLRSSGFSPADIMRLFALSAAVSLGLDVILIWLLLKLIKIYQSSPAPAPTRENKPQATGGFTPAQLNAPPAVIHSVTEHTTRNFDQYEAGARARQSGRDTNEV